jgi:hypothetical protein
VLILPLIWLDEQRLNPAAKWHDGQISGESHLALRCNPLKIGVKSKKTSKTPRKTV